jgi:hypothetical protein
VLQNRNQAEVLSACLPSEALPNLQFVNGLSFGKDVQNILSKYTGPGLITVGSCVSSWAVPEFSGFLRRLEILHPQIQEIHAWLGDHCQPSDFNQISARAPRVTTVGVHLAFPPRQARTCDLTVAMHRLVAFPWTKAFPNLKTIRLMECVDFKSYRAHDDVTRRSLCSPGRYLKHPIRVEDRDGLFLAQFAAGVAALVEL